MINKFYSTRRSLLTIGIVVAVAGAMAGEAEETWLTAHALPAEATVQLDDSAIKYLPGDMLTIEGRGFDDTATTWSRLPERYKDKVTGAVWGNSRMSAGIALRFITDSPVIHASWEAPRKPMNHMAHSGSNGLDLYAWDNDSWDYIGTGIPETTGPTTSRLFPRKYANAVADENTTAPAREYLLFLPTYSNTTRLQIGIGPKGKIAPGSDRYDGKNPIVFYGTSISQAGCAPRSGLGHIERLRRMLDYPTVNLGFSGSGKCEPAMADVLADIPAALYVIETVPNMTAELVAERGLPFIERLRSKQPDTPILMVESPNIGLNADRNTDWRNVYDRAIAAGIENLHYLKGDSLYGNADDPTVDGVHPTDLGFYQMAIHYAPAIREILGPAVSPHNAGGL